MMTLPNVVFSKQKIFLRKYFLRVTHQTATLTPTTATTTTTTTTTLATPSTQTERPHECVKTKNENQIKRETV